MISSDRAIYLHQAPPTQNHFQEILDRAASLEELGLTIEAVAEYQRLFPGHCPPTRIIPGLVACLAKTHSPSKIIRKIEEMASQANVNKNRLAQFRICVGVEIEKRGNKDLALELLDTIKGCPPVLMIIH